MYFGFGVEAFAEGLRSGIDLGTRLAELKWRKEERERQRKLQEEAYDALLSFATRLDEYYAGRSTQETPEVTREKAPPASPLGQLSVDPDFMRAVAAASLWSENLAIALLRYKQSIDEGNREIAALHRQYLKDLIDFIREVGPENITDVEAIKKVLLPELEPLAEAYFEVLRQTDKEKLRGMKVLEQAKTPYGFEAASKIFPEYGLPEAKEVQPDYRVQLQKILEENYKQGLLSGEQYSRALLALAGAKSDSLEEQISAVEKAIGRKLNETEVLRLAGIVAPLKPPQTTTGEATFELSASDRWIAQRILNDAATLYDPEPTQENINRFLLQTSELPMSLRRYIATQLAAQGYLDPAWVRRYMYGDVTTGPEELAVPAAKETQSEEQPKPGLLERIRRFFSGRKREDVSNMTTEELIRLAASSPPDSEVGRAAYEELKKRGVVK